MLCTNCMKGYCSQCGQQVRTAVVCPDCDGLCIRSAQYDVDLKRDAQRSRSMFEDLGTILGYPLNDVASFVLLSLFTWVFGVAAKFSIYGTLLALLLSKGVLFWYSFSALTRVANGNLKPGMPEFRDIWDLVRALLLGFCATVVSAGPFIAIGFVAPGVALLSMTSNDVPSLARVHAQPPATPQPDEDEEDEEIPLPTPVPSGYRPSLPPGAFPGAQEGERVPPGGMAALAGVAILWLILTGIALIWQLLYTPAAVTVAALSHSYGQTLNPLMGIHVISKMGGVYWQAWLIYGILAGIEWLLGLALGLIPILGGLVLAFVSAYVFLAIGCTMGLAVFKRAKELDWD